jgi:hypothetical protein
MEYFKRQAQVTHITLIWKGKCVQGNQYQGSRFFTRVVFAALMALPLTSFATVYKCKASNGSTVF